MNDERPIKWKQSSRSAKENEWIKGQIDEMLKNRVIEPSTSPYAFNIVIVKKKDRMGEGYVSITHLLMKSLKRIVDLSP